MKQKLFITLLFISTLCFSQNEYKYCELVGTAKFFSNKVYVSVDSGQGFNWDFIKDSVDIISNVETRNEKFYITTELTTYEGKTVQTDAKGKYIWKKVEIGGATEKKVKPKVFNSMVEGMNYMGKQGWEFKQAYVVTIGSQNVYRWLLIKKK